MGDQNRTYKCQIETEHNAITGNRFAAIKPDGFWAYDMISVSQNSGFGEKILGKPRINWGSGGRDNKLSEIECTESFIQGLSEAVKIAKIWDVDTGKAI